MAQAGEDASHVGEAADDAGTWDRRGESRTRAISPLSTAFTPNRSLTPLSTAFTQTHRGVGYLAVQSNVPDLPTFKRSDLQSVILSALCFHSAFPSYQKATRLLGVTQRLMTGTIEEIKLLASRSTFYADKRELRRLGLWPPSAVSVDLPGLRLPPLEQLLSDYIVLLPQVQRDRAA